MPGEEIEIRPADAGTWDDLADLFGRGGASNGCWCQYWLLGADYHHRDRQLNRADLKAQIINGPSGLLAYRCGRPVGWARLGERDQLHWLTERFGQYRFIGAGVYALPCLYVRGAERGTGVMTALIAAALDWAKANGKVLQAYPIDPRVDGATRNRFTGVLPAFIAAGFTEVGRLAADRAVVQWGTTEGEPV